MNENYMISIMTHILLREIQNPFTLLGTFELLCGEGKSQQWRMWKAFLTVHWTVNQMSIL